MDNRVFVEAEQFEGGDDGEEDGGDDGEEGLVVEGDDEEEFNGVGRQQRGMMLEVFDVIGGQAF